MCNSQEGRKEGREKDSGNETTPPLQVEINYEVVAGSQVAGGGRKTVHKIWNCALGYWARLYLERTVLIFEAIQ